MLADLLAYLLHPRVRVFVEQSDNTERLAAYRRRSADHYAADPVAWDFRCMAGRAVQRRASQGPRKANVLSLTRNRRQA